jgi:hypothetical protein
LWFSVCLRGAVFVSKDRPFYCLIRTICIIDRALSNVISAVSAEFDGFSNTVGDVSFDNVLNGNDVHYAIDMCNMLNHLKGGGDPQPCPDCPPGF